MVGKRGSAVKARGLRREQVPPALRPGHRVHMDAGEHRARQAPHQLADRQGRVPLATLPDEVGNVGRRSDPHGHKRGTEIAQQEGAMRCVLCGGELDRAGFEQTRQHGSEVDAGARCLAPCKIVEPPDHAGSTKIEVCHPVRNPVLPWVRRPEPLGVEPRDSVRNNLPDCGGCLGRTPWQRPQRDVKRRLDHRSTLTASSAHPQRLHALAAVARRGR